MAFGKAVAAEPLDLLEGALGEVLRIAALDHTAHQLVVEVADAAGQLEGRHRAAQLISLGRSEPRADDRDLHRLFLEQRHAERLLEHRAQFGFGILGPLLALPPA